MCLLHLSEPDFIRRSLPPENKVLPCMPDFITGWVGQHSAHDGQLSSHSNLMTHSQVFSYHLCPLGSHLKRRLKRSHISRGWYNFDPICLSRESSVGACQSLHIDPYVPQTHQEPLDLLGHRAQMGEQHCNLDFLQSFHFFRTYWKLVVFWVTQ